MINKPKLETIPEHDIVDQNDSYSIHTNESPSSDDSVDSEKELSISIETIDPINVKKRQSWKHILMLSFSSLGVIYGDLGTSPLYTLSSIKYKQHPPNKDDIYGAVSIIFYAFTIIVLIKYVLIVLVIGDNNGEGGQVAIYAKIARHLNIGPPGVQIPGGGSNTISDLQLLSRQDTIESCCSTTSRINKVKQNPFMISSIKTSILLACFIGCSLVVSDGLLTPTASILSAVEGIQVANPSFKHVLAVSEVILLVLFAIQQFGSNKISYLFAPIVLIWMVGLFVCGFYNIIKYHPAIFRALSPYYAIKLLKDNGLQVFGGAILAITGTEAMFADLGHFGKLPIQLTLGIFVFPTLIICYLGQAAYIIEHPEAYINPFFLSLPGGTGGWIYWTMFILATLATIIASQALILSVFSIFAQLISLDCFPKLQITHVSAKHPGKVYIGIINWMLMIGVMVTMAGFKTSENTTAAYGLGITLDLFVTSTLIIICMFYVYNCNIIWPILYGLIFVPLEICFIIANIEKIPHGAWFPIMISVLLTLLLVVWRWCRSQKVQQACRSKIKIDDLYPSESTRQDNQFVNVHTRFGKLPLVRHEGLGIMYVDNLLNDSPNTLPQSYNRLVSTFVSIPFNFVFCGVRVLDVPIVPHDERILMVHMKLPGHYKCILRFGYVEDIRITKELIMRIKNNIEELRTLNNIQLENYPTFHFFENDIIRCQEYEPTRNPFVFLSRFFRKVVIDYFFRPLSTRDPGRLLKIADKEEMECKIYIGGIVRI
ncbi:High affinity potassium transporter [Spathaspora sp. JA1]|nr:High affinity potassium transporter [Spathaspora sp. JA1]